MPVGDSVLRFVEQFGYIAFFLLVLVEESGIPMPIPGDGIMLFAGYNAAAGNLSFPAVFLVMEVATLLGASGLRLLGMRGGHYLLTRYGRLLHLDENRIARAEVWFARHGTLAIVLGRLVPGLRIVTSFMAGTFEVPYWRFLPGVAVGSSLYILFFMALGYGLGNEAGAILDYIQTHPLRAAGLVLALIFLGSAVTLVWRRFRR